MSLAANSPRPMRADGSGPTLYPNVCSVLAIDPLSVSDIGDAFFVSRSTASKWKSASRIPLRYCTPFLRLMSWDMLAFGSVAGTIHENRGYTRDIDAACHAADQPGPIFLAYRTEIGDVLNRIRLIIGSAEYRNIGEGLRTDRNQVATWVKRKKIPDAVYHGFCERYQVSLAWLVAGNGDEPCLKP